MEPARNGIAVDADDLVAERAQDARESDLRANAIAVGAGVSDDGDGLSGDGVEKGAEERCVSWKIHGGIVAGGEWRVASRKSVLLRPMPREPVRIKNIRELF